MRKMLRILIVVLAASMVTASEDAARWPEREYYGHVDRHRNPLVISMTFSPDGRRLVATYYVHAQNRIGTDWHAFAAQWDLKTGERLILGNAYHPVAFSPDGQTIAMGSYNRRLALWKPGADKPYRELKLPGKNDVVRSATFYRDGKRVAGMMASGELLLWHTDGDRKPTVLDKIATGKAGYWRGLAPGPGLAFSAQNDLLATFGPARRRGMRPAVLWRFDPDSNTAKREKTYTAGLVTRDAAAVRVIGQAASWPGWAYLFAAEKTGKASAKYRALQGPVAFSPETRMLAFADGWKITLSRFDGKILRQFSNGQPPSPWRRGNAVAFGDKGRLLACADGKGVIRLWDTQTGKFLRMLRLDDRATDSVRVAAIQCHSIFAAPEHNRKKLEGLIRQAAKQPRFIHQPGGAKIVVLPETAVTGYLRSDLKVAWGLPGQKLREGLIGVDPKPFAETVPGKSSEAFGKLADELNIYLTVPLLEVDRKTGKYYNTSLLFGPDGKMLIHYRKRDPWQWAEQGWATAGDLGNPVVETPYGRLGLLICYDIHEQAKVMKGLGVHTLLYSIAWVDDEKSDWFAKRLPAVAKKNNFNIIGTNWTVPKVPKPKWHGYGQSRIIDRTGKILAKAKDDLADEIIYADIPLPSWLVKEPDKAARAR